MNEKGSNLLLVVSSYNKARSSSPLPPWLPLHTYRTVVYGLLCLQPILHLSYSQQIKEIRLKSLRASGCSASALPTRDYTEFTLLYGTELDMNFILCWRDQRQRWQQLWILLILHLLAWRSLQLQILNLRSSCFSIRNFRLKWLRSFSSIYR